MLGAIAQVPGVAAATVDGCTPVGTTCANSGLYFHGRPNPPDLVPSVLRHYVGPDHFKALGIPVLRGRVFTDADRAGRNKVAVISRSAARRFWPNEDLDAIIGQRVWFGARAYETADSSAEIVGIVGDVAYQPLDQNPFQADFYTPYLQFTYANRMVLVRAQGRDPLALVPELRRAVRAADPDLAPVDIRTMEDRLAGSWAKPRFYAFLLGSFSVAAILLAASGIYAVVAYTVGQRTREMGIRLALGAAAPDVLALVVRQGFTLPLAGIAIGVAVALGATRTLRSLLYEVSPTNPAVLAGVAGLVAVVALLACYFPARRVTRIDPLLALKAE
jgi:putative ABC transport system permease protein